MQWTSTRLSMRKATARPIRLQKAPISGWVTSAAQVKTARLRAIRSMWHGNARRKNCAAKADSWAGSAKAPVTGCIAMAAGAAASRSGSCSLLGAALARSAAAVALGI
eukprot:scaffold29950_cov60-Phaeocystis_antarctica.AAC.5